MIAVCLMLWGNLYVDLEIIEDCFSLFIWPSSYVLGRPQLCEAIYWYEFSIRAIVEVLAIVGRLFLIDVEYHLWMIVPIKEYD